MYTYLYQILVSILTNQSSKAVQYVYTAVLMFAYLSIQYVTFSFSSLRHKITDEDSVVVFKMASWSTLKLEGWSNSSNLDNPNGEQHNSRLRLIAGETKIRIAFKRLMSNSSMLATRISVHLGDIIWIVTQTQLRAVSKLVQSLMEAAVHTAQAARRDREGQDSDRESVDSLESVMSTESGGSKASAGSEAGNDKKKVSGGEKTKKARPRKSLTEKERIIKQRITDYRDGRLTVPPYEVVQDSFHLCSGKIELQLCDDTKESRTAQGSMLLQLRELVVDVYFDQPAGVGRAHWNKSNDLIAKNTRLVACLV